jgi:AcrR family transcriptional regulator
MSTQPFMGRGLDEAKQRRVISAATGVFLKYGYGRVTMHDLASAAGISRPALYLIFPKKEEVFRGVVRELARQTSDEVRQGLGALTSPVDKLRFVCEVWIVRPFDWITQSPETREVYESSHAFAQDVVEDSLKSFERDLLSAMARLPKGALPRGVLPAHAARLMAGAIVGLKTRCRNSAELRDEIHALIATMIRA